jgi:hypothetical protein
LQVGSKGTNLEKRHGKDWGFWGWKSWVD